MGEDGKVIYKVVIDDTGVESEAEAAGQKAGSGVERGARPGTSGFQEAMIGAARKIGEAFVEMAAKAVQGVEQIAQAGIEFNAKMEQYSTAFTTLLGDAEEADRVMAQIRKDAASTPFDVDSLTQANQMLISAGISADQARGDVLNLANAIAATGGGSAELSRMAANMQQIRNTGKATAMDIRQFANAGINIYGLLADYTGKTVAEVSELDVSYEVLAGALAKASSEGGKFYGAMEAQSQTFNGRMSTLKDNATQLAGALTEDLFNKLSGEGLPMVMDWVATLLDAAQTGGIEGAIATAKEILSNLFQTFMDGLPEALDAGIKFLIQFISGLISGIPKARETIFSLLNTLIDAIIDNLPAIVATGMDLIFALIEGLFDMQFDLAQVGIKLVMALAQCIGDQGPEFFSKAAYLLGRLIAGIINAIPDVLSAILELLKQLILAFINTDWRSVGANIVEGIKNGLSAMGGALIEAAKQLAANAWQAAKNWLGIRSPSKKFAYIGEMSVEGMAEGFEDEEATLTRTVNTVAGNMFDAAAAGLSNGDLERSVSYNLSASSAGTTIIVPLTLDGREIARATAWSMGEQLAWEEI